MTEPESTSDGELEIPVKRTTGESIQDRLTGNAYHNIIPSRYLKKDENGEPIEEPEGLFERVAKNISIPEAIYTDETVWVDPTHIKPDHPRRDELIRDVFGQEGSDGTFGAVPGVTNVRHEEEVVEFYDSDVSEWRDWSTLSVAQQEAIRVELNEENAKYVAYEPFVEKGDLPEQSHKAVVEVKEQFQSLLEQLGWIPNSPTLMNAGDELQQLAACFVNSPADDMGNIYKTVREASTVMQSGGGMGYDFSQLRPYGDVVGSSGGIASGPITFMRSYDIMCETISQGGTRRGAQMANMRITHPDVPFFIHSKNKDVSLARSLRLNDPDDTTHTSFGDALGEAREALDKFTDDEGRINKHLRNAIEAHLANFNISVTVTDGYMEAVVNDEEYTLINPRTGDPHIATEETKELWSWFDLDEHVEVGEPLEVPARALWDGIAEGAHENGEPGVIYIDRVNDDHAFPVESNSAKNKEYEVSATNPCGEEPLMEYDACNLGHINLSTIVAEEPEYDGRLAERPLGTQASEISSRAGAHVTDQDFRAWHAEVAAMGDVPKDDPEHIRLFLDQALDLDRLDRRIELGVRFLDNVITMSNYSFGDGEDGTFDKIEEVVQNNRKIGLGIMGLAQLYIQLGVEYGSDVGNEMATQLMQYIEHRSKEESHALAEERGPFATWEDSKYANPEEYGVWFRQHTGKSPSQWADGYPQRDYNTLTIAPTGTTSMLGNTSGGCEPIYSVAYYKNVSEDVQGDEKLVEFDDYFLRMLKANDLDVDAVKEEALTQMEANEFSGVSGLETVPDKLGEHFVTTDEISFEEHVEVQTALQTHVDAAISKTINAPNHSTIEDAQKAFEQIWQDGGKGVTYYRDGSRTKQVVTTRDDNVQFADMDEEEVPEEVAEQIGDLFDGLGEFLGEPAGKELLKNSDREVVIEAIREVYNGELARGLATPRPRPDVLYGPTQRIDTGYGKVYVEINEDADGRPFELFATIGDSGGLMNSFTEAIAKVVSIAIRSGVDPHEITDELQGIRAPRVAYDKTERIDSVPDAIGTALDRYLNDNLPTEGARQQKLDEHATTESGDTDQAAASPDGGEVKVRSDAGKSRGESGELRDPEHGADVESAIERGESPECPECGRDQLYYSEGCKTCRACGWSEC